MDIKLKNYLSTLIWLVVTLICIKEVNSSTCSTQLEKCTSAVNPLLKNVSYMFPSSKEELSRMCVVWSNMVDCIRHFIKNCFSQNRKETFNFAVQNSIGTVHSICISDLYQQQYLEKAVCFRDISIKNCKFYFNQLIDMVTNPKAKDSHLCCAYAKFRECVDVPLEKQCGHISRNLMDHSLTFLIHKCNSPIYALSHYDNCQIPVVLTGSSSGLSTQRKLEDQISNPPYDQAGGFYPINPQLVSPYLMKKPENNYQASNEEIDNESTTTIEKESNRQPRVENTVEDEFQLNQASRFNRQDDDLEAEKPREYSTLSPEYMVPQFSPQELHNNSSFLALNSNLLNLLILYYLISKLFSSL